MNSVLLEMFCPILFIFKTTLTWINIKEWEILGEHNCSRHQEISDSRGYPSLLSLEIPNWLDVMVSGTAPSHLKIRRSDPRGSLITFVLPSTQFNTNYGQLGRHKIDLLKDLNLAQELVVRLKDHQDRAEGETNLQETLQWAGVRRESRLTGQRTGHGCQLPAGRILRGVHCQEERGRELQGQEEPGGA